MERHWNALKFTCGLMEDSSVLIERICEEFVEIVTRTKEIESFGSLYGTLYLTDIEQEKSAKSMSPFINPQLCYIRPIYGHIPTNPEVHLNYRLFYLNGWDVTFLRKITKRDLEWHRAWKKYGKGKNLTPCSVVIHQGLYKPLGYFLKLCSGIIQPIKCLLVFGQDQPRCGYFTARPQAGSTRTAVRPKARSEQTKQIPVPVGPKAGSVPDRQILVSVGPIPGYVHLSTVVLHKVNCQYLAKSLNECKQLIHLTYFKCRDPSFEALGNNKGLEEITVQDCTLGANAEAELFAQLKYLTQLEKISSKGMKCEKYLAKLTKEGVLSSLELLKSISLQQCILTTPTVVALMKSLAQCPLMEINLSDNFLFGFIKELHQTPDVSFRHLERMKCNNCDLVEADTMALARLLSENRFPVIKAVFMKGNILANDKAASEELEKSCEDFRRRKGHRVQVYMY